MSAVQITWLGHSTFEVLLPDGKVLLIDPWIDGNPSHPAEHSLTRVDLLLITHGHSDHFNDAVSVARRFQPQVVAIFEICQWLGSKGVKNLAPMNKGGTQKVVVGLPDGRSFYHAGDTCVFSDMQLIRELYRPQLAMLPIGDHFTMGPREAALACRFLQPAKVIPMHYGTFPMLTGRPEKLQELLQEHPNAPEVVVLRAGQPYEW